MSQHEHQPPVQHRPQPRFTLGSAKHSLRPWPAWVSITGKLHGRFTVQLPRVRSGILPGARYGRKEVAASRLLPAPSLHQRPCSSYHRSWLRMGRCPASHDHDPPIAQGTEHRPEAQLLADAAARKGRTAPAPARAPAMGRHAIERKRERSSSPPADVLRDADRCKVAGRVATATAGQRSYSIASGRGSPPRSAGASPSAMAPVRHCA
jgi:hypothetical protein